jgi:hypothetical protein
MNLFLAVHLRTSYSSSHTHPQHALEEAVLSPEDAACILEDLDTNPENGEESRKSSFLTAGGLRGCRPALAFYLMGSFLPPGEHWICYTIMLYFLNDLDNPMYTCSLISTMHVGFMGASPSISYLACIASERILYPERMVPYGKDKSKISVVHYLGI